MAGGFLGTLGGLFAEQVRLGMGFLLAVAGVALGFADLTWNLGVPMQCNKETPRAWMNRHPLEWSLKNGAALGIGAFTRLGFLAWYLVPCAALVSGSPSVGCAVWGIYGFTRTVLPAFKTSVAGRSERALEVYVFSCMARNGLAHRISALALVSVGLAAIAVSA